MLGAGMMAEVLSKLDKKEEGGGCAGNDRLNEDADEDADENDDVLDVEDDDVVNEDREG